MKYYFIRFNEINGEHEYSQEFLTKARSEDTLKTKLHKLMSKWYSGDPCTIIEDKYHFYNSGIFLEKFYAKEVNLSRFNILKEYLTQLG